MRLTKREFVRAASAVAVAVSVPRSAFDSARVEDIATAAAPMAARWPSFDVVVYNDWFPQAREFATRFPAARILAVGGDAGQLWYGTLRGLVNTGLRRIAGVTSHTDLLILETLAREVGLRVRSRNESGRLVQWTLTP